MVNRIITFCTLEYYPSSKRSLLSLKKHFPQARSQIFRPRNLNSEFINQNASILKHKIGAGYWVWKSEIIYQTLCSMSYGEDLMYTDSGILYHKINRVAIESKLKCQGVFITYLPGNIESSYTNEHTLDTLEVPQHHRQDLQFQAGILIIRKTPQTMQYIDEWRRLSKRQDLLTDIHTKTNEIHRHDQSLLSLTTKKYGFSGIRDIADPSNDPQLWNVVVTRKSSRLLKLIRRVFKIKN